MVLDITQKAQNLSIIVVQHTIPVDDVWAFCMTFKITFFSLITMFDDLVETWDF